MEAEGEERLVIVQELIRGTEVTCGVLDDGLVGSAQALLPTEIIPTTAALFDYQAKYQVGAAQEITPARLSPQRLIAIQQAAVIAHEALGCSGISRSDFIVEATGRVIILETNTIPGLTETSLITRALPALQMTYSQLLTRMIDAGIRRHQPSA